MSSADTPPHTGLADRGGITYAFQASSGAGWGPSRRSCECAMMAELPSSSSGPGRRPFKAVARVRIPLGVRTDLGRSSSVTPAVQLGPVEQLECSPPCQGGGRGFKSRQDRKRWSAVRITRGVRRLGPGNPGWYDGPTARPGSSVGTSVRLKIGRSAVRPRPWPPSLSPGFERRPPAETCGGRSAVRPLFGPSRATRG